MRRIGGIVIPEKDTYKVQSTFSYSMFRFIDGNRTVDHSEKIEKVIKEAGLLVIPILVNERFEIVDGQNRFTACRNLGLPIYYIVQPGIGVDEIATLNSASKNWTGLNHIHYYAHSEKKISDYVYFENLMKAYPWATQRVLAYAVHGLSGFGFVSKVKTGDLKCSIEQYENAVRTLEYVEQFRDYIDKIGGRKEYYYFTVAFCYSDEKVDNDYLLKKFGKYGDTLKPVTSIKGAIEQVEKKIYNYQLRSPNEPVIISADYEKAMIAKRSRRNGKEV